MLKNEPWIHFSPYMMTEWQQCMDEGLDVESYKSICEEIAKNGRDDDFAWRIAQKMYAAPVRDGYRYDEPSDYETIIAKRPASRNNFDKPDNSLMLEKLRGAWTGRIAGCLLGKPVECMRRKFFYPLLKGTGNYPMHKYIERCEISDEILEESHIDLNIQTAWADEAGGIMPVDDDTNYTVFGLNLIEKRGRNFTSSDVLEGWLRLIPYFFVCTAERVAYRNGTLGLLPPETASYKNPFREWIGAQIRGDFYGYINPGNPEAAASMAWRDASISHKKNGIYGEMFVAAMIAAAAATDDILMIIESGLQQIPENCRLHHDVELVIEWYNSGFDREEIIDKIHEVHDENPEHGWCHTNSNAMIVTMALLVGNGDFGKSICAAVQAAFDTDCNGATVGSIVGMRNGFKRIPEEWKEPFKGKLMTTIQGNENVTVDELAERTFKLI